MAESTHNVQFEIDSGSCVACLSCVRECPVHAIAVDGKSVTIVDEACVRCGACVPACPHDAVDVLGDLGKALELASRGDAVLLLSVEAEVFFHPLKPEQLINACYRAGFQTVQRGVVGDELVAEEYLRLWKDGGWGTMIRSTCPIIVEKVRSEYPRLTPYLAPVKNPVSAELAYIRKQHGEDVNVVYAGVCLGESEDLASTITFPELDQLFRARGVDPASEPTYFTRVPEERRRHIGLAGGLPLPVLEEVPQSSRRFRKIRRDMNQLDVIDKAVTEDGIDLGFVDILPCEGCLDHPLMGPREELFWRRDVLEKAEPPRSNEPILDDEIELDLSKKFAPMANRDSPPEEVIAEVLAQIGTAAGGKAWDCGACGYRTCRKFASAFLKGRATYRQCPPYQERAVKEAQDEAATDVLTGLSTFRVLQDQLRHEVARSGRSGDSFGVLFADLDHFKEINDIHGHSAGNLVIKTVADVLRTKTRSSDLAARYGGDEFVVLLLGTDIVGAKRVAEQILQAVRDAGVDAGFPDGAVSVSIGVTCYKPGPVGASPPDLLEMADRALYRAKAAGGNRIEVEDYEVDSFVR